MPNKRQREAELQAEKDRRDAAERLAAAETAAKEQAQAHAVVLKKRSATLRRVLIATAVTAVIALVGAVVAVVGVVQATAARHQADARTREAVALKLTSQGQSMLAGIQGGGDARALQQILAAPQIAPTAADTGALFAGVVALRNTLKIIPTGGVTSSVAFSPDGRRHGLGEQRQDAAAVGRRVRPTRGSADDRPHRRGEQRGVQPRRAAHRLRQLGLHAAAVGRRHRPTGGAADDRPHRRGEQRGVQPRRPAHRLRQCRSDTATVGRPHRPTRGAADDRPHRRGEQRGVQPRRATHRLGQFRSDTAAVGRPHRTAPRSADRVRRRSVRRGVQSRRAPRRIGQLTKRHAAVVGCRHRPARRPADARFGQWCGVQPGRPTTGVGKCATTR